MIDIRRLFGKHVSGKLTRRSVKKMWWEVHDAEMAPTLKLTAKAILDGLNDDEVWDYLHDELGSDMTRVTAGWYISRAYAAMRDMFASQWRELGLKSVLVVEGDMTTTELAEMLCIAPCTLRGKMEKAQGLGLPMPERMLGRTLRRYRYIFPKAVAEAWARAYMEGQL